MFGMQPSARYLQALVLSGQQGLYGAASWHEPQGQVILKLVHTGTTPLEVTLPIAGITSKTPVEWNRLHSSNPQTVNSFENPKAIWPTSVTATATDGALEVTLEPSSVNVIRITL